MMYFKLFAALVVVAVVIGIGVTIRGWYVDAQRVPALEAEIEQLRGELDSTNMSLSKCHESIQQQNALVEQYYARAMAAERAVDKAVRDVHALNQWWMEKWKTVPPPPPDCCGAIKWLAENVPNCWN